MKGDLFVSGTDTGVGKSVLSALLVTALRRKYWKPIQTGACEGADRDAVMKWAGIAADRAHPETFLFDPPVSPHLAAEQQGIRIDLNRIRRPEDPEPIVAEGAGGLLVPINEAQFMTDLVARLDMPVVLAARTALGTINHTLLSLGALRRAGLKLRGVVMIGPDNDDNRRAIERYGDAPVIGTIPWLDSIDALSLQRVFDQRFEGSAFQ
jgi:dethiobiotin synthase